MLNHFYQELSELDFVTEKKFHEQIGQNPKSNIGIFYITFLPSPVHVRIPKREETHREQHLPL